MNIVHVKIKKIRDVAMFGRCLEIKWEIQLYIVASLVVKMNINIECVQKEMGDVAMIDCWQQIGCEYLTFFI